MRLLVDLSNLEGQLYQKKLDIRAALRRLNITNADDLYKRDMIEAKMIDTAANLQAIKLLMSELSDHPEEPFEPTLEETQANTPTI